MKGQVSSELLIIVALVLLVFIPLLIMVYFKSADASQRVSSYESELTVSRLAYLSNAVGSLGTNTTMYTDVYVPRDMVSLTTAPIGNGGEIVMVLNSNDGEKEIVEIVKHRIDNAETLAEEPSYGWIRVEITSVYNPDGSSEISIKRA